MTPGECYRKVLLFEKPDFIPNVEHGAMSPQVERDWRREGLPAGRSIEEFFGIPSCNHWSNWINDGHYDPLPGVEGQGWFDRTEDHYQVRDCWGRVTQWYRRGEEAENNARRVIRDALQTREEWEALRTHFDPDHPLRQIDNDHDTGGRELVVPSVVGAPYAFQGVGITSAALRKARAGGLTLQFNAPSMLGSLKEVMGFENLCMKIFLERDMVEDLIAARAEIGARLIERFFAVEPMDILHFWEDIAFKSGPLFGPDMLEALALKHYRRLIDLFKAKGGRIVSVDCDGDIRLLIPVWLKAGVNFIWPMEANAGMDVAALRRQYGKTFAMLGGIDKLALLKDRDAIDRQLDRVAPVVADGGYIPMLDHSIPCGVPFERFCYYTGLSQVLSVAEG